MGRGCKGSSRRRLGARSGLVLVLALIGLVFNPAALLAQTGDPDPAQTGQTDDVTMLVRAGIANTFRANDSTVIQVTISSDRLLQATLTIGDPFRADVTRVVDVEVAGGTTKDYLVALDTFDQVEASLVEAGTQIGSTRLSIDRARFEELIGVMPDLADSHPATIDHTVDLSPSRLGPIDHRWLALGAESLGALDAIIATATDLAELAESELAELERWILLGGTLVFDEPGGRIPELGLTLTDARTPFGQGRIVTTNGALARGDWDGVIPPSPAVAANSEWGGGFWFGPPVETELASRTGFELPTVPGVIATLGAYTLIAGPLLWWLLRRRQRLGALWLAVPVLAVVFTGAIWVAGSALRADVRDAHAMIVQVIETPAGPAAEAYEVLVLAPRGGGEIAVDLPTAWVPRRPSDQFGGFSTEPAVIAEHDGKLRVTRNVDDGGVISVHASGPVDRLAGAVELAARANPGGDIEVTLTNNLAVTLQQVGLITTTEGQLLGDLEPGQTVVVTFGPTHRGDLGNALASSMWQSMPDRFEPWGRTEPDTVVSGGLLNLLFSDDNPLSAGGEMTMIGWTDALESHLRPHVDPGSALVTTRTRIDAPVVTSTMLRSPSGLTDGEDFGANRFVARWLWEYELPQGTDPGLVVAELDRGVADVAIWSVDRGEWVEIQNPTVGSWSFDPGTIDGGVVTIKIGIGEGPAFEMGSPAELKIRVVEPGDTAEIVGTLGATTEAES